MTAIASTQMTRIGPRSRTRGKRIPRKVLPTIDSESRAVTRYPAKKIASAILASSPGWNEKGPIAIHTRAPEMVRPIPGSTGSSSSTIALNIAM